jgi:hypothetical protein
MEGGKRDLKRIALAIGHSDALDVFRLVHHKLRFWSACAMKAGFLLGVPQ